MRQLTAVGADVDAEDSSGATPLLWAMQRYGASSPTVVALKAAKAAKEDIMPKVWWPPY